MQKRELNGFWILLGLAVLAYLPTFIWMVDRWTAKDTYYSHGFLIPVISIALVWLQKDTFAALVSKPSNFGWIWFSAGIGVHAISALLRVYFTSGFSFILVLIGLVLIFLGKKFIKPLLFPILFLIFMIPLPLVAIANISFRLKIFAAQLATGIVNQMGIMAMRDGSVIRTAHAYLIVEDPCSGIRSLIALIALGALMAYISKVSNVKKVILFISAIPIAVIGNVVRIVILTLGSEMYGAKLVTDQFHTIMGMVVFVFAFLALTIVGRLLE
ncbi:MAG: exosortase/archaeosortase family protein [Candidatus Omnitrophica bacterium]|nr:exosortase/archaeosortase family protein [Candidatus Omnitrophota bacterium]